ncbi:MULTISPECIES: asparaginase [Bradyrhizobium]|uniref:Asparaginase n=3 Tax=Bradyrhizobium TaxID=374 RepID=A0AAE6CCA4_9BRAD|nr:MULTISPECIES: asparaginase [Bradyrhizobium]MCG2629380.1 asparaginase [Bradyrhizobium zhengyangense]MCG2644661.1 asparaginase [Bradyrhizobium zhengyangense]MCG2670894.1 asparaginase [Bradyrhizobium zhengyangense]MDN4984527.1 asparaginase [Bradyrhizobium sp. WYCCWR 13022]MDN5002519.1 asparaginase [Bradyrhizobium sp. WYCCWR 12677]
MSLPLVYVLTTGGTIAGKGDSSVRPADYEVGLLTGNDLVQAIPELAQLADTRVIEIANIGSQDISFGHWKKLAETANGLLSSKEENIAGIVVTHGTDTLEETAYFLNLTMKSDKPVVLVGSQRPPTAMSTDGPYNLYSAVRVAIQPEAAGKGTLVVMNEQINAAREVVKTSTFRLEAFKSGDFGLLGYVDTDRIVFYRAPVRRHGNNSEFDIKNINELPTVHIVYSYADAPGTPIRDALASGAKGVVIAGAGAGTLSQNEKAAVAAYRKTGGEAIIMRSSRTERARH